MPRNDWVPGREQDLADLLEMWKLYLSEPAKSAAFGWDSTEVAVLLGKIDAFFAARKAYQQDRTPANRITKDAKKGEAASEMRRFANKNIRYNDKMPDAAKLEMGIHQRDTNPTIHTAPTAQPDLQVDNTKNHYEHLLRTENRDTGDKSKPADAHGVRYAWQLGGAKPASGEDLPKSKFTRKTDIVMRHGEMCKGFTVYYAACYENSRGEPGPWSPVVEAVIG